MHHSYPKRSIYRHARRYQSYPTPSPKKPGQPQKMPIASSPARSSTGPASARPSSLFTPSTHAIAFIKRADTSCRPRRKSRDPKDSSKPSNSLGSNLALREDAGTHLQQRPSLRGQSRRSRRHHSSAQRRQPRRRQNRRRQVRSCGRNIVVLTLAIPH